MHNSSKNKSVSLLLVKLSKDQFPTFIFFLPGVLFILNLKWDQVSLVFFLLSKSRKSVPIATQKITINQLRVRIVSSNAIPKKSRKIVKPAPGLIFFMLYIFRIDIFLLYRGCQLFYFYNLPYKVDYCSPYTDNNGIGHEQKPERSSEPC